MKLRPAPGGPEMSRALSNQYVLGIVAILRRILDQEFFRDVALFLNTYNQRSQDNFAEALADLRTSFQIFPDEDGLFTVPSFVDELIHMLEALYQYDDRTVGFLRGAIVEQLTFQPVSQRYFSGECASNHRFLDMHGREVTGQIDVAALSHINYFAEGYECKIRARSTYGLMSEDCDNLKALARVAHDERYCVHVGVVAFDNDKLVRMRLLHFNAPPYIKAYGLNSIIDLRTLPQYIEPDDDLEH
jgi:hypothetical protein